MNNDEFPPKQSGPFKFTNIQTGSSVAAALIVAALTGRTIAAALIVVALLRCGAAFAGETAAKAGEKGHLYTVTLTCVALDSDNLDTLAARWGVIDKNGADRYPPLGLSLYHDADEGYFYSGGAFCVTVPDGPTVIHVCHGFEYVPVTDTVLIAADTTVEYHLERFVDMTAAGWFSGDVQVHIHHAGGYYNLDPDDAHRVGLAEGCNVMNCLDNDFCFSGAPDPVSTPECIVYMSEEYRSGTYGHMDLLGLSSLVYPTGSCWWPMNGEIADSVHAQAGALVISAHPVSTDDYWDIDDWPGNGLARELPVDVISGSMDGFEVMCYSNYRTGGIETDLWYHLLNCGFRLTACAGTDAALNRLYDNPPGGYKTYVSIPAGDFTFCAWLEHLEAGSTFVTNGPLITTFEVGGVQPGGIMKLDGGWYELEGRLSVTCAFALSRAEIVMNGNIVETLYFDMDSGSLDETFTVRISESAWVAARVMGFDDHWAIIGDTLFAHTNPVYFELGGARIVKQTDAEHLRAWVSALQILCSEEGEWSDPDDSLLVYASLVEAYDYYDSLMAGFTDVNVVNGPAVDRFEPYLGLNLPNPFSGGTHIDFGLRANLPGCEAGDAYPGTRGIPCDITIYDVTGRVVRRLFSGHLPNGGRRVYWNGAGSGGNPMSSGVYFCRLATPGGAVSRKLILLR